MDFKNFNSLNALFYILIVILAFALGRYIKDYPLLTLKTDVSIVEVVNVVITVALAIFIPIFIRKVIERRDKRNDVVFDSLKDLKEVLENLQSRFTTFYTKSKIVPENKTELYVYTVIFETKLSSFQKVWEEVCGNNSISKINKLKESYIPLWSQLTGETISDLDYTVIDEDFFKQEIVLYQSVIDNIADLNLFLID